MTDTEVKQSGIADAGMGVFALRDFKKGENVLQYTGEMFTRQDCPDQDHRYCVGVTNTTCLCAKYNWKTAGRYVNAPYKTGLKANLRFVIRQASEPKEVWLKATRLIRAGKELLVGYGPGYWRGV